jgi:hypothetical protein
MISVPGAISGTVIIDDLLNRIGDRLARDCSLRSTDAYRAYSARVTVELQLHDVYEAEVTAEVQVGSIDGQQASQQIVIEEAATADAACNRSGLQPSSLERPIDFGSAAVNEAAAPMRRQYVSRIRGRH